THYLDEADTMAERVLIMDEGRIIADGTPERLKANLAGDRLHLSFAADEAAADAAAMAQRLPGARDVVRDGRTLTATVRDGEAVLPEFIGQLHAHGVKVATANVKRPTLDDVFLGLTGRSLRENAAAA